MRPGYFWQSPIHLMVVVIVALVLFGASRLIKFMK
jgi:Sec-independent protein translocase protein TatA